MADVDSIREAFKTGAYIFSAHASDRAAKRTIRADEIEQAIANAEIIEDYQDDKYGPSCLLFGYSQAQRPLHVQVSYPPDVKIVTVYEPSPDEWESDLRTRKTE